MAKIGYILTASAEDLKQAVMRIPWNGAVAMLERSYCESGQEPVRFTWHDPSSDGDVEIWDKGRIFDSTREIRWERGGETLHITMIADKGDLPEQFKQVRDDCSGGETREFILWGEKIADENGWFEKQVPHTFKYPVKEHGKRVYLKIKTYKIGDDPIDDSLPVFRYTGVICK